jgi:Domain of unknown function (DUF1707)
MTDNNGIRLGDAEREDAVRRLGEHYEAGRLSSDEHGERVEEALRAKTYADLGALFADLPGDNPGAKAKAEQQPGPQQPPWAGQRPPWAGQRPPWAGKGGRGPLGLPIPLAILAGVLIVAGLACAIGGGHPPVLALIGLGIVAFTVIRRKGRPQRA